MWYFGQTQVIYSFRESGAQVNLIQTTSTKAGDYAKGMLHQLEEKKRSSCSLSILFTFCEQTRRSILKMAGEDEIEGSDRKIL